MAHGLEARGRLRGDDPAVAVGDHHGRLFARGQDVPDRGDILGQPGPCRIRRHTRLAATRQGVMSPPPRPRSASSSPVRCHHHDPSFTHAPCTKTPPQSSLSRNVRRTDRYVKICGGWGRQRQPQIRQRLLDACTDHALEQGLPDRLGPLAAAAGTSNRMLIYHFGTRDGLLREVLGQARRRQVEAFTDLIRLRGDEPYLMLSPAPGPRSPGRRASPTSASSADCTTPRENHSGPASGGPRRPTGSRRSRKACAASAVPNWRPWCSPSSAACSWTSTPPATPHAPTGHSTTSSPRSPGVDGENNAVPVPATSRGDRDLRLSATAWSPTG